MADYTNGIGITAGLDTAGNAVSHHIDLASGSAADSAPAVNTANIGVRAAVVNTDAGRILQFTSAKTGEASKFDFDRPNGFTDTINLIADAKDAHVSMGISPCSYSISS